MQAMTMKCDRCGNESKYLIKVLSEQDITGTGTRSRGTEQTTVPPPLEAQWCIACINQQQL
jgi:hypothetical protein